MTVRLDCCRQRTERAYPDRGEAECPKKSKYRRLNRAGYGHGSSREIPTVPEGVPQDAAATPGVMRRGGAMGR
jgi:hypothetical protein